MEWYDILYLASVLAGLIWLFTPKKPNKGDKPEGLPEHKHNIGRP